MQSQYVVRCGDKSPENIGGFLYTMPINDDIHLITHVWTNPQGHRGHGHSHELLDQVTRDADKEDQTLWLQRDEQQSPLEQLDKLYKDHGFQYDDSIGGEPEGAMSRKPQIGQHLGAAKNDKLGDCYRQAYNALMDAPEGWTMVHGDMLSSLDRRPGGPYPNGHAVLIDTENNLHDPVSNLTWPDGAWQHVYNFQPGARTFTKDEAQREAEARDYDAGPWHETKTDYNRFGKQAIVNPIKLHLPWVDLQGLTPKQSAFQQTHPVVRQRILDDFFRNGEHKSYVSLAGIHSIQSQLDGMRQRAGYPSPYIHPSQPQPWHTGLSVDPTVIRPGPEYTPKHRLYGAVEPGTSSIDLTVEDYDGREGNNGHITRNEQGMVPISWVRRMLGVNGEMPFEHRRYQNDEWEHFKNQVAAGTPGYNSPIFITVEHGKEPRISEGNHRRDAYDELGATHVPVQIRYFGHAERQGTVGERWQRRLDAVRREAAVPDETGLKAAGIAVIAMDTGRVLMQQRALNPLMCPCGMGVTWDEMNGYQHNDGSVGHDGEFYGQSVSDLLDQGHPEPVPCPCCDGCGDDEEGGECSSCDGAGSNPDGPPCDPPCRTQDPDHMDSDSDPGVDQGISRYLDQDGSDEPVENGGIQTTSRRGAQENRSSDLIRMVLQSEGGVDQGFFRYPDHEDIDGLDKTAALEYDPNEGTWEFPGGKLDEGESPRAAAIREFREEVGQDLPPGVFVGAWVSPGGISVAASLRTEAEYHAPPPEDVSWFNDQGAKYGWKQDKGFGDDPRFFVRGLPNGNEHKISWMPLTGKWLGSITDSAGNFLPKDPDFKTPEFESARAAHHGLNGLETSMARGQDFERHRVHRTPETNQGYGHERTVEHQIAPHEFNRDLFQRMNSTQHEAVSDAPFGDIEDFKRMGWKPLRQGNDVVWEKRSGPGTSDGFRHRATYEEDPNSPTGYSWLLNSFAGSDFIGDTGNDYGYSNHLTPQDVEAKTHEREGEWLDKTLAQGKFKPPMSQPRPIMIPSETDHREPFGRFDRSKPLSAVDMSPANDFHPMRRLNGAGNWWEERKPAVLLPTTHGEHNIAYLPDDSDDVDPMWSRIVDPDNLDRANPSHDPFMELKPMHDPGRSHIHSPSFGKLCDDCYMNESDEFPKDDEHFEETGHKPMITPRYAAANRDDYEYEYSTPSADGWSQRNHAIIASKDGRYAGGISWSPSSGEIERFFVVPAHRGTGLSTELWRRSKEIDPNIVATFMTSKGHRFFEKNSAKAPVYKCFIYLIQSEKDIDLGNRALANPDDPDGDMSEQSAWWDIEHAKKNPALRAEVKKDTPWDELALWADKSVRTNREVMSMVQRFAARDPYLPDTFSDESQPAVRSQIRNSEDNLVRVKDPSHTRMDNPSGDAFLEFKPFLDSGPLMEYYNRGYRPCENCWMNKGHAHAKTLNHFETTGHKPLEPHRYLAVTAEKCMYCKQPSTKKITHSEGMAYIPVCDKHFGKGKDAAEHCVPGGEYTSDNIDTIKEASTQKPWWVYSA